MKELSIEEAIAKKVPSMSPGCYRDAEILEQKCSKCGGRVVCVYDDLGATDYYDNYAHICLNSECDFVLHQENFTCNVGGRGSSESETCVFCGRKIRMTF